MYPNPELSVPLEMNLLPSLRSQSSAAVLEFSCVSPARDAVVKPAIPKATPGRRMELMDYASG